MIHEGLGGVAWGRTVYFGDPRIPFHGTLPVPIFRCEIRAIAARPEGVGLPTPLPKKVVRSRRLFHNFLQSAIPNGTADTPPTPLRFQASFSCGFTTGNPAADGTLMGEGAGYGSGVPLQSHITQWPEWGGRPGQKDGYIPV
jgi:hypothetical protein